MNIFLTAFNINSLLERVYSQKNIDKTYCFFVGILKVTEEKSRILIRSRIRIRNTGKRETVLFFSLSETFLMFDQLKYCSSMKIIFCWEMPCFKMFLLMHKYTFSYKFPVLRIRIRDPVPFWPLDPGSGRGFFRIPDLGSPIPDPKPIYLRAKWKFFG